VVAWIGRNGTGVGMANDRAGVETRYLQPIPEVAETLGCGQNALRQSWGRSQGNIRIDHTPNEGYDSRGGRQVCRGDVGNGRDGPTDVKP